MVQVFVAFWIAAHQASLSITNPQSLLKFMSNESVVLSNHLILCYPLLLPSIFPNIRAFSKEAALPIRWPRYGNISFSNSPSNEYSGLISFLVWSSWRPRDSQVSSLAPQFESFNSSALSLLYGPTLISVHNYWKNYSFDYTDLCWQSDLFASYTTLSSFVIAFLPRSLLISKLQSPSIVILL